MSPYKEFYLCTLWAYRPKAVERIIAELNGLELKKAEFIYDLKTGWFKIICNVADIARVQEQFRDTTSKIENAAFKEDYDAILNGDGTLKPSFESDLIGHEHTPVTSGGESDTLHKLSLPPMFWKFAHAAIWTKLEEDVENPAIQDLLSGEEFTEIQRDTSVTITCNLSGKEVYIGASDKLSVQEAQGRLEVLLEIEKLPPMQAEHVLFAEDYVEPDLPHFTADTRYMANINPKLVTSTLLDRACLPNLEKSYRLIYQKGTSIRLCTFDRQKNCHVSLFGPRILPRTNISGKPKAPSGNLNAASTTPDTSSANVNAQSSAARIKASSEFIDEIKAAMKRLLLTCPYRRGKVSVWAEFGRAILVGMDPSALAFNGPGQPSNGWQKYELLQGLNSQIKDHGRSKVPIHFTKILCTNVHDVEDMIKAKWGGTDVQVWQPKQQDSWTIYSFHCEVYDMVNPACFVVDIRSERDNTFSYTIRSHATLHEADDKENTAVLVHGLLRNWDLRIVVSHTNPAAMERRFGKFAAELVQSLRVQTKTGVVDLAFSAPNNFNIAIKRVRVLTKSRYLSLDSLSALEITKVEQLDVGHQANNPDPSGDKDQERHARPWTNEQIRTLKTKGEVPRWYEASVVSTVMEKAFLDNECLRLGEKSKWAVDDLNLATIYQPALQTLTKMDQVGGGEDNSIPRTKETQVLRPNKTPLTIPGL
ncbi:hypothetical protein B0T19DRAFT_471883 [Cercophora scortea]|uniref:Uncharacterized protein n=1 Tax=Cercophora scortea TaxID=314031 RepID=A0AAE0J4R1_9PEZI|nr:hypothetical protein B0T19DRAFT_471883 [Cercophora scortea]